VATRKISFDPEVNRVGLRRIAITLVVLLGSAFVFSQCLTRIDAAHVGIKVKLAGSGRGVQDIPVVTGWVLYNPLTEQVISFPTSVQSVIWTKNPHEGRTVDESITFSSQEGVNVNADIGLSFHIEPSKAPHLYLRFRQPDLELLAYSYVRNSVREAFSEIASHMAVQDIYGAGKSKLQADVAKRLGEVLGPDGFIIDQLTINGALGLPDNVKDAINRAMEATQNAIQAENRVRQVRAEAEQAIAEAHGAAEAARQRAEGDADAILIRSRAEAKSNEIIRLSTTGSVLQYRAIERWDGKLPMMQSGDKLPLLTFDTSKLGLSDAEREKKLQELLAEDKAKDKSVSEPAPAQVVPASPPSPPAQ